MVANSSVRCKGFLRSVENDSQYKKRFNTELRETLPQTDVELPRHC